ncbi:DNA primase [Rickettsiales bacterium]|nr:DNA primase [Rickettsiales bacterium]
MKYTIEDILSKFNNKIRLSEYLSKYVELIPRGDGFVARCPFHNEKTPSFSINDQKGLFYCFGCGVGGNVFTFLTKYEKITFTESLKIVSSELGIKVSDKNINIRNTKEIKGYELLYQCNEFFKKELLNNKTAKSYLNSRSISDKLVKKFEIGYCDQNSENLVTFLESKGFSLPEIYDQGILIKSSKNKKHFSRFSDRITFPIFSFSRKIIGFGGRTISNSKIKYINSAENIIFKKSENLYGLEQNINDIKKNNELILVEGYLDVIGLNSKKIETSVASLGTTLSETQINKIWSIVDIPIICFDGDIAGLKAMKSIALKVLKYLKPGKSIKFVILPEGQDPDNYVNEFGKESFEELKLNAKNLSDFVWEIIIGENNQTPEFLALIDEEIKRISNIIENKLVSSEYFSFFKSKKNDYVWNLRKFDKKLSSQKQKKYLPTAKKYKSQKNNEKILLSFLLFEEEIINDFLEEIVRIQFEDNLLEEKKRVIVKKIIENEQADKVLDIVNYTKNKIEGLVESLESTRNNHFKNLNQIEKKKLIEGVILNLRLPNLIEQRENIKRKISELSNSTEMEKYINMHEKITKEINIIKKREF